MIPMIPSTPHPLLDRWTYDDRQRLTVATYGLPKEHTVKFEVDDDGHDFATVTPGYPEGSSGRFIFGWAEGGHVAVTDQTTGAQAVGLTMSEGADIMRSMERSWWKSRRFP
jgi:hypothetical protein